MADKKNNVNDTGKNSEPEQDEIYEVSGEDNSEQIENEDNTSDASEKTAETNSYLKKMFDVNFIEYASYVIKDRAIPDIDDGLKPVQRRILWVLREHDDGTFHKVANIVGSTMRYHPHGDASINDALVNVANKEYFIDRQGNYGSVILGKPAAAGRYIECRLAPLAREVMFNNDITELVDSYDGRNREPVVLPAKIPSLLLLGAEGIAVTTATKIMPHNFNELLQAQIAILKGEDFTLYPDFIQGGIMDVSKYEDGMGKILLRAKLEIEEGKRNIEVREIPAGTDTGKLMDSIETAIAKGKIKISSVKDYSAENVDIQLVPLRGYSPHKALNALYAYTDCQVSITCLPMVIMDNKPARVSVSTILRRNTEKLLQYLKWELEIEAAACLNKILTRTLAQIFIEEGIYKRIEKCKTRDSMFEEVRLGLEKFRDEWQGYVELLHEAILNGPRIVPLSKEETERLEQLSSGIVPDIEIQKLLEIPIRRISAFEKDANREEIELLQKQLDAANRNLKRLKQYAVKYIQGLIDKYGKLYPRRTEICLDGFEKINRSEVALTNIRVGWDRKNCYIGTNVKSDDYFMCSEYDHLLCVERTGEYKVIGIPEKIFIDRLFEFRRYDKTTVFGIVYSDKKTSKVYFKRTVIDKFITDREYRLIPDGCKLELITPRPGAVYEIKIDTPIRAKQVQSVNLLDAPLRSPKAGGSLLSPRKLLKITFLNYVDDNTDDSEPPLLEVESETDTPETPDTPDDSSSGSVESVSTHAKKSSARKKHEDDASSDESKASGKASDDDEDWGIQPDLGF